MKNSRCERRRRLTGPFHSQKSGPSSWTHDSQLIRGTPMTRRNFEELPIVIVLPILWTVLSMGCDSSHAGLKTFGDGAVGAGSGGISGQATTIASEPTGTEGLYGTGGTAGPVGTTGMGRA